ncbi:M20 family metallo-hydrolase [Alkalihalobacillus oceani]|uniref:M20 family metallo-hydrolase n=1 Tax=Halalkalibacter oceani TaxID=1653776 RepID=A0A9X2DMH1_9BACI|nr:M20 family metallo-hydrolase [Halalkalibacter oceani]MCM3712998.1 M20 family metallo-hydrolase [Halalkalibacter oceani]
MISSKRLNERIETLGKISEQIEGWEGVTRLALSEKEKEAKVLVKSWMEQAGLSIYTDPAGNLIGRKEGLKPGLKPVVIGSHMDTTFNAGKYDGTLGVIAGLEVAQHINEEGIEIMRPLEVIAINDEEGVRFRDGGLFGSRAMTGKLNKEDLNLKDENGISRRQALESFGLNPDEIKKAVRKKEELELYLEMHIEQGPVLVEAGVPVGIIQGINGRYFGQVIVEGEANHCGGTPMGMRHDAFIGASEIVIGLEEILSDYSSPTVGTICTAEISPGADNIIAGRVVLSGIDIRDLDNSRRDSIVEQLKARAQEIGSRREVKIEFNDMLRTSSAMCSSHIKERMLIEAKNMKLSYIEMPSGACHDAQLMAELCDMGMIFVRSTGGSHNPNEHAKIEDIALGTELLSRTALSYLS